MDPEKLYNIYYMRVYSYIMSISGNRSLSEEITQETFLRALSTQSTFRGESDIGTWLCAIAKNLFLDEIRSLRRSFAGTDGHNAEKAFISEQESPEIALEDMDTAQRIHSALDKLEEPYSEVFRQRVFGELSFAEIAVIHRKTESWARVTYHRARLKIRERIGADDE
ncbi:MAG: RNA polymerase sigma factor [Clostridia bacterium]|nr:RNA polymerase sigma factor [Clostridia bacterium]